MPRQNVFSIIPQISHQEPNYATRPMTSKQVRKAHKAATKQPVMTRAERFKWEREEQERIRKDHEKEKAAAKAKAARDKKREKEMAAREEKRRNGLPLVNVRPSQDTIARFVRGNGSGMKRDAQGKTVTAGDQDLEEGLEVEDEEQVEQEAQEAQEAKERQQELQREEIKMTNTALESIMEMEEEMEDAPETVVQQGITGNEAGNDAGLSSINNQDSSRHHAAAEDDETTVHNDVSEEPSQGISPKNKRTKHNETNVTFSQDYETDLALEDVMDEAEISAALDLVQANIPIVATENVPNVNIAHQTEDDEPAKKGSAIFISSQDLLLDDEDLNLEMMEELNQLMAGPADLPRPIQASHNEATKNVQFKSSVPKNGHGNTMKLASPIYSTPRRTKKSPSQRRVQMQSSSPLPPRQTPPMSTQAILTNFDDFFPTSSQQLRELEEEDEPAQGMDQTAHSTTDGKEQPKTTALTAQPVSNTRTIMQQETAPQPIPVQKEVAKKYVEMDDFESDFGSFPSTAHFSFSEIPTAQQPKQTALIHQTPHIRRTPPPLLIQAQDAASTHQSMSRLLSAAQQPQQTASLHRTPQVQPAASSAEQLVSEPLPMSPPPPKTPKPSNDEKPRFFTSSGSREQLSIALQRSRRSAAREEMQERDRQRQEAGYWLLQKKKKQEEAAAAAPQREVSTAAVETPPTPEMLGNGATHDDNTPKQKKYTADGIKGRGHDKENVQPPARGEIVGGSQESEYGGDWVDDAAWDLGLC